MGLRNLARHFASSFHRVCQCRPGQSARKLASLSPCGFHRAAYFCLVKRELLLSRFPDFECQPEHQCFGLLWNPCFFFFFSVIVFSNLHWVCVYVCFCSTAKWAHCWHRLGHCSFWLLYALSSSPFAFLVCWKGSFLFFFLSQPSPFCAQYRSFLCITFLWENPSHFLIPTHPLSD